VALSWRINDPRESQGQESGALAAHQQWTSERHASRTLELTFTLNLPSSSSSEQERRRGLFGALVAGISRYFGRQIMVFGPIVLLHLGAFYVISNEELRISRALTPIIVRFVPFENPTKPPDPPMLAAGEFNVDNALTQVLPPQLEYDVVETSFVTQAASRVQAPITPEPAEEEVVETGEEGGFVRPRPIRGPSGIDRYPSGSIAAKESGRATITICISASGKIEKVELAKSTGFERLDSAALDIARQYLFKPAMRNNKPVPVCLPYTINYKLK
jgi:TonB family protein